MRAITICALIAIGWSCAAGEVWDEEFYQRTGRTLRATVDRLAESEGVPGQFRAEAWGKAQAHISIYLDTWAATGAEKYLQFAKTPADFLIAARQPCGGYSHTLFVHELGAEETNPSYVTFRDARDRSAIEAILSVYDATGDTRYLQAARETADFLLEAQYDVGAWPSVWPPPESGWLRLPMLNDYVTLSQTRVLMEVYRRTGEDRYLEGIRKVGAFFVEWQLPEPTPGWAQQYNFDRTPAWGRAFEPPSACGLPSTRALDLLIDMYLLTGDEHSLEPIPDALAWLERSKTGPNEWARFYEPATGRPIYAAKHDERDIRYDRELLYEGYMQWGNWGVEAVRARWERLRKLGRTALIADEAAPVTDADLLQRATNLRPQVTELIELDGRLAAYPDAGADLRKLASAVHSVRLYLEAVQQLRERGLSPGSPAGRQTEMQGTNADIQKLVDEAAARGGGEVVIPAGEYLCHNSVMLADNVVLRGNGEVVLRKSDGFSRPLVSDCGFYHDRVKVADPAEWQVGWGVTLQSKENPRGFFDDVRTIAAIEGDDLILDRPVDHADFTVRGGATVQNVFPLIAGYDVTNAVVEGIICDGNRAANPPLNGCRGGALYLFRSEGCEIRGCVARDFNGDGISFQVSPYTTVAGCQVHSNAGLGLHPGAGSHHTTIRDCDVYENEGVGLFLCWRVAHSRFEGNHIHDNGDYGISVGHKDTDNFFAGNLIEGNGRHGVYLRDEPDYNAGHRCTFSENTIRNNGGPEDAAVWVDGFTADTRIIDNQIADDRETPAACALHIGPNVGDVKWEGNTVTGFECIVDPE